MLSAQNSRKILQVDEHVRFRGFNLIHESPPQLYIDDYTLMREVSDVLKMREGDHCIVGVNLMHKLFRWSDAACNFLTSYHIMPFYHHFVLIDSVTSLSSVGEPLNACGQPCRVLEFSDTISGVWRKIVADGRSPPTLLRNAATYLRSPAKLHTPPLSDYLPLDGRGVFVVAEELSAEDRERTAAAARALAEQARSGRRPAYRVFSSNCEHLAWSVDTTSRRWISPQVCGTRARASFPLTPHPLSSHRTPSAHTVVLSFQVPHNLWKLARLGLQALSLGWLYVLHVTPPSLTWTHTFAATSYHLLSTVPVGAQTQVILVRTCVNLKGRRARGSLAPRDYDYLMAVEVSRACFVMVLSVGCVCMMPRLVWDTGCFRLACSLSMCSHSLAQYLYSSVQIALCRLLLALGVGVPVARFDDARDNATRAEGDVARRAAVAAAERTRSRTRTRSRRDAQVDTSRQPTAGGGSRRRAGRSPSRGERE